MSRDKRRRFKGRRESGGFSAWPRACHEHDNYQRLSFPAKALIHELLYQYRGANNGDLCCAWGIVGKRWKHSRTTLDRAEDELIATGWIVRTRAGSRNRPHLYALTFLALDQCGGKLDAGWHARPALGYWKLGHDPLVASMEDAA